MVVETLDVGVQNFSTFSCSASNCGVGSVRTFVSDTLRIDPADYDVIVGLGESSPCSPIAGCSNGTDTIWVTAAYDSVTAHELGHIYGLEDEYAVTRLALRTLVATMETTRVMGQLRGMSTGWTRANPVTVHLTDPMIQVARHVVISEDVVALL